MALAYGLSTRKLGKWPVDQEAELNHLHLRLKKVPGLAFRVQSYNRKL
jgi:hypothetical protein